MGVQAGFFDVERRYEKLDETRDFLSRINMIVDWEAFRPTLDAALKVRIARLVAVLRMIAC